MLIGVVVGIVVVGVLAYATGLAKLLLVSYRPSSLANHLSVG
jgi:hypothetical protein